MRLQITHLSAPWPAGAVVGDVVEMPHIPAWAVGKCEQLPDLEAAPAPHEEVATDEPEKPRRGRPPKAKE